jgi:hypothetical protein
MLHGAISAVRTGASRHIAAILRIIEERHGKQARIRYYLKILQSAYKQLQPTRFEDLCVLQQSRLL